MEARATTRKFVSCMIVVGWLVVWLSVGVLCKLTDWINWKLEMMGCDTKVGAGECLYTGKVQEGSSGREVIMSRDAHEDLKIMGRVSMATEHSLTLTQTQNKGEGSRSRSSRLRRCPSCFLWA